eukprot:TRINITY_DN6702_c0_g2_i1.p1 TRINITY_DN6702_c0_g2~~TRINITY_DN6702_c0_g2_i1.p1  ORF type:complete len:995 (+),score=414.61 TRINITY_DN6702_c0_g2_i1:51-3035(+)
MPVHPARVHPARRAARAGAKGGHAEPPPPPVEYVEWGPAAGRGGVVAPLPPVRRYRFTSVSDWYVPDDTVLWKVDRRLRDQFAKLPAAAAQEAAFTHDLYALLSHIVKKDPTPPQPLTAVEWASYLNVGGASTQEPPRSDVEQPAPAAALSVEVDGEVAALDLMVASGKTGGVAARPAPTQRDDDNDRRNAVALRRRFQHIRAVSERLPLAKKLVKMLNGMRATGYVGIQTYRVAFLALSRMARGSTLDAVYERMKLDGVRPDQKMFNLVLQVWSKRSVMQTRHYLGEMIRLGVAGDYIRWGGDVHELLGMVAHAAAFGGDVPPDEHARPARQRRVAAALAIARDRKVQVRESAYIPFLMLSPSYEDAVEVVRQMLREPGVRVTAKALNAVLYVCVATGAPQHAEAFLKLIEDLKYPVGAPQYRALLQAYERVGDAAGVHSAWARMVDAGVVPTSRAYAVLFRTYLAQIAPPDAAMALGEGKGAAPEEQPGFGAQYQRTAALAAAKRHFDAAVGEHGHAGAVNLWNSMLEVYVAAGVEGDAVAHLARMKAAGLPANARCRALYERLTGTPMKGWQTLGKIDDDKTLAHYLSLRYKLPSKNAEYAVRKRPALAAKYTAALEADLKEHSVCYGPTTASICVKLYSGLADVAAARAHFDAFARDFPNATPEEVTDAAVAMMGGYTNVRDLDKVMDTWHAAKALGGVPSPLMCAQLLWGLVKAGARAPRVQALMKGMVAAGVELPETAAVAAISACATTAEAEAAREECGAAVTPQVVGAMLKAAAREKSLAGAQRVFGLLQAHGVAPRAREYIALMNVCKEEGDVDALLATQRLMSTADLPAHDVDVYVVQSIVLHCLRNAVADASAAPPTDDRRAFCLSLARHAVAQVPPPPHAPQAAADVRAMAKAAREVYTACGAEPCDALAALLGTAAPPPAARKAKAKAKAAKVKVKVKAKKGKTKGAVAKRKKSPKRQKAAPAAAGAVEEIGGKGWKWEAL